MNTLIIAEKPSVARSIASVLGANKRNDGYFEGNGYFVSFAFGHLYTLADSRDYDPNMASWNLKHYPFIPDPFHYKAVDDPGIKKQIRILKDLLKQSDSVINALDADREGELIFAEIKQDLKIDKPIKRLWITSHTPKDIEKGMANLKSNMTRLEQAGYCRQQVDWIIGINLTVVYTLKAGGNYTLKIGRVLLPTLKLIFDREVEIANFRSQPFYRLIATFEKEGESYSGVYHDSEGHHKFDSKETLQQIQEIIRGKAGAVARKISRLSEKNAPHLFSLTDLQGHMTRKYESFTGDKVLSVMQSLYEKKHLTYPRTASRYLNESQIPDAEESLTAILTLSELSLKDPGQVKFHTDKRVFNDEKVDSHPAIMPTYMVPDIDRLSPDEKLVYIEVTKRFLALFLPPAIYDTLELETVVEGHSFITKGKVLIDEGWKQLFSKEKDPTEEDLDESISAKSILEGDCVQVLQGDLNEGQTKPPAHYTEETLLRAMLNCGKAVEDEEEVLKGFTIGTSSTRAETIKKLIDIDYIMKKGKNLLLTELGVKVISNFPVKRLMKVSFTGQIEKTLKDIENGDYDPAMFMEKMSEFIKKNVREMISSEIPIIEKPRNILGRCPDCGREVIENAKAYSCEGSRDQGCTFTLWKDDKFFKHFGKRMTERIARELVKNQKTTVKGFKSVKKPGVKFDATVLLKKNADTGYWNYELSFDEKGQKKESRFSRK
jgi:DNA topoisomerase-3